MKIILKYAGIAFVAQLFIIGIALVCLEGFGIESFWSFLMVLYISPADAVLKLLSANPRGAGGSMVLVASTIPILIYSFLFGFALLAWRKSKHA